MHDDREVLKTGQLKPLRTMEEVTKDYNKASQELSYSTYMQYLAQKEVDAQGTKIKATLAKMEDLNKEGAIIEKNTKKEVTNEETSH